MTSNSKETTQSFNYEEINQKFNFLIKHAADDYPRTQKQIDNIIFLLKTNKEKGSFYNKNNFVVAEINDEQVLINNGDENRCKVIPLEECFNVIVEAHLFLGHGTVNETSDMIAERYYIPFEWIHALVTMCNVCNHHMINKITRLKKDDKIWHTAYASIIQKEDESGLCHNILLYIDQLSDYCILRYLNSFYKYEIAMEFFKIFADFGVPKDIFSNSKSKHTIRTSLKTLSGDSIFIFQPVIKNHSLGTNPDMEYVDKILSLIDNFLTPHNGNHYPILLSSLQFQINTSSIRLLDRVKICNYFELFKVDENINMCNFTEPIENMFQNHKHKQHVATSICYECSKPVYKEFICHKCNNIFHFTCCERECLNKSQSYRTVCTTCKFTILID